MFSKQATIDEQEPNTLVIEDPTLYHGFVQLPKLVLYARNLSRDAKLLYAVLLGYAWQEKRCFPGYQRLCDDLDASENMVRKCMRELEAAHLLSQRRRGQGRTNIYILHDLRTAKIAVQEHHKIAVVEPQESQDNEETVKKQREGVSELPTASEDNASAQVAYAWIDNVPLTEKGKHPPSA
jgi:DNA-binding transcriptional MocR family regulator